MENFTGGQTLLACIQKYMYWILEFTNGHNFSTSSGNRLKIYIFLAKWNMIFPFLEFIQLQLQVYQLSIMWVTNCRKRPISWLLFNSFLQTSWPSRNFNIISKVAFGSVNHLSCFHVAFQITVGFPEHYDFTNVLQLILCSRNFCSFSNGGLIGIPMHWTLHHRTSTVYYL